MARVVKRTMTDRRINTLDDRNTRMRSRKVPANTGKLPRGVTRKPTVPSSDLDLRLEKAADIAFRLGGED